MDPIVPSTAEYSLFLSIISYLTQEHILYISSFRNPHWFIQRRRRKHSKSIARYPIGLRLGSHSVWCRLQLTT